jgi:hypothetical protein
LYGRYRDDFTNCGYRAKQKVKQNTNSDWPNNPHLSPPQSIFNNNVELDGEGCRNGAATGAITKLLKHLARIGMLDGDSQECQV